MRTNKKTNSRKDQLNGEIMGLSVFSKTKSGLLKEIQQNMSHNNKSFLVTLNPEIALQARKNTKYFDILSSADYLVADGIGIAAALEYQEKIHGSKTIFSKLYHGATTGLEVVFKSKHLAEKWNLIKGRDLVIDLCDLAEAKGYRVFLLGSLPFINERAAIRLKERCPSLDLEYSAGAQTLDALGNPATELDKRLEKEALAAIKKFKPHFLIVAFGAPKQEFWIHKWMNKLPVGCALGVGGTLDYISGQAALPPAFLERFEYAWRLVRQPRRIKRILRATFVFPVEVFKESLH